MTTFLGWIVASRLVWFLCGVSAGAFVGVSVVALCMAGARGDRAVAFGARRWN